ncbi:MAG: bifunctional DNA-formamidopyrimidine glycosylase/DNA-(apurinic or apyrimidinic site) lyase [Acidobacteria bacterium]|nr:bifunctional DNA-formamidopyrimidine glycosylase/DNA-(apurinic or apyrimidinic site) lyase [Acidobacteriota bacterium]MBP7474101.1 bifunctional DNA-formamidopyrimidine glycosylase/DNA-(apurinic or apyrimidinic site) lyase [Pyrinomonadaceae bacterium]MBP9108492.1 bifunctional DNA-formamidopyrimidine glycosylase/DNA-(apurinic or apyrimidinic site) lyase [Pyrinomonadaceae bacterium]
MPELPEVESISRSLDSLVKGRTISAAELLRQRLAPDIDAKDFAKKLNGHHINFVHRRGKHILFDLNGDMTLIVHLRMSGRFSLLPAERENPKFTHAIFHLNGDDRLVFDDQRHFGLMKIVSTSELYEAKDLKKLAPEPFSEEFSREYFYSVLKTSKRSLKEVLLDQTKVCGVGNIYASEAMFAAGIHPAIQSDKVSRPKAAKLHESVRAVLQEAINYAANLTVDPENLEGSYFSGSDDPSWLVYDRENEPCRHCNTVIVRLKQGGRSTYFCRKCQRR